jgi:RNA polymerase sigma factor (sigma-70 family)
MAGEHSGAVLKDFHTLFRVGSAGALTDGQLLDQFTGRESETAEAAFQVLVDRHGPMVLRVCRGVLGDHHDAQDAFQATFLVLARRAAAIRKRDSVGSWLYGVALRLARRAKVEAARRRALERRSAAMTPRSTEDPGLPESWNELHEEIGRLPDHYRAPVVLCYLENLTHEQAASQLRWPLGTVKVRLSRARELLKGRLTRRGIALPAGVLAAALAHDATAAVPEALRTLTVHAAVQVAAGQAAARVTSSQVAALMEGMLTIMMLNKLKLAGATVLISIVLASGAGVLAQQTARSRPAGIGPAGADAAVNPESLQTRADPLPPPAENGRNPVLDPDAARPRGERKDLRPPQPGGFPPEPARALDEPALAENTDPVPPPPDDTAPPQANAMLAMAEPVQTRPRNEAILGDDAELWEVKPDPTGKPLPEVKDGLKLRVPDSFGGGDVVYPTAPSPFVAVGGNSDRNRVRQVWDLVTQKRVGMLRGDVKIDKPYALSADGALFAAKMTFDRGFVVFDTKANRMVAACRVDLPFADYVDFVGPNWLITGETGKPVFQVWNLKTQQVALEIHPPERVMKESVILSPGRKYLAMICQSKLLVYDVSNGKLVGEAGVPKKNNVHEMHCKGLAFSPDGTELAGVFEMFGVSVLCWNVANGSRSAQYEFDDKSGIKSRLNERVGAIDWLPDKSGWLVFGATIVDRKTGEKLFTIPTDTADADTGPRKVFGGNQVLITVGNNQQRMVRGYTLSKETIEKAAKIVREGGSASDAILPALKTGDIASAKRIAPESHAPSWSASPDPAAAAKPISRRSLTLRCMANEPQRLFFSDPSSGQVAIVSIPGGFNAFDPNQNEGKSRVVDRYDLTTSKLLGRAELPGIIDPIALSPDGTRIMMVDTKERRRIDVFDMVANKHVAGWRPYPDESGNDRAVVWADFLTPDRVLSVNKAGTLILWSLPDCKAIYIADGACEGAPALSPGRKLLAGYLGGTIRIVDAATGATRGEGATPTSARNGRTALNALAFNADGSALVALVNGNQLVRWDLNTGNVNIDFQTSVTANAEPNNKNRILECAGPNHVLLAGRTLIDLVHRAHVWSYFGSELGTSGPDGRHWLITGFFGQTAGLRSMTLPEPNVDRVVALVNDPNVKALLRVKSRVTVKLEMTGPANDPQRFQKELTDQLNAKLRANDMITGDGGPLWLIVHVDERDTGKTIAYRNFGDSPFAPPRHQMAIKALDCEVQLADSQSRITLVPKHSIEMPSPHFLHMPPGETSVEQYLRKLHWASVKGYLGSIGLPYFVARLSDGGVAMLPGVSNLNELR